MKLNFLKEALSINEDSQNRFNQIQDLKSWGKNYRFDNYSDAQIFRIWQKEQNKQNSPVKINDDSKTSYSQPTWGKCPNCGHELNDAGECPVCDLGDESARDNTDDSLDESFGWTEEEIADVRKDINIKRIQKMGSHTEATWDDVDNTPVGGWIVIYNDEALEDMGEYEVQLYSPDQEEEALTAFDNYNYGRLIMTKVSPTEWQAASKKLISKNNIKAIFKIKKLSKLSLEDKNEEGVFNGVHYGYWFRVYPLDEDGGELDAFDDGFDDLSKAIDFAKKQKEPTHIVCIPKVDPDEGPEAQEWWEENSNYDPYEVVWRSNKADESLNKNNSNLSGYLNFLWDGKLPGHNEDKGKVGLNAIRSFLRVNKSDHLSYKETQLPSGATSFEIRYDPSFWGESKLKDILSERRRSYESLKETKESSNYDNAPFTYKQMEQDLAVELAGTKPFTFNVDWEQEFEECKKILTRHGWDYDWYTDDGGSGDGMIYKFSCTKKEKIKEQFDPYINSKVKIKIGYGLPREGNSGKIVTYEGEAEGDKFTIQFEDGEEGDYTSDELIFSRLKEQLISTDADYIKNDLDRADIPFEYNDDGLFSFSNYDDARRGEEIICQVVGTNYDRFSDTDIQIWDKDDEDILDDSEDGLSEDYTPKYKIQVKIDDEWTDWGSSTLGENDSRLYKLGQIYDDVRVVDNVKDLSGGHTASVYKMSEGQDKSSLIGLELMYTQLADKFEYKQNATEHDKNVAQQYRDKADEIHDRLRQQKKLPESNNMVTMHIRDAAAGDPDSPKDQAHIFAVTDNGDDTYTLEVGAEDERRALFNLFDKYKFVNVVSKKPSPEYKGILNLKIQLSENLKEDWSQNIKQTETSHKYKGYTITQIYDTYNDINYWEVFADRDSGYPLFKGNTRAEAKAFIDQKTQSPMNEDTIKQNGKWVNKGKEGTHGTFKTKKAANAQRRAMFANGFKEDLLKENLVTKLTTITKAKDWLKQHPEVKAEWNKFKYDNGDIVDTTDLIRADKIIARLEYDPTTGEAVDDHEQVRDFNESLSQDIKQTYDKLKSKYGFDLEPLVQEFEETHPHPEFAGDIIYNEKLWNEFVTWLDKEKQIKLKLQEALETDPVLKKVAHFVDTFGSQITVDKEDESKVRTYLQKHNISFIIDDHPGTSRKNRRTFIVKYPDTRKGGKKPIGESFRGKWKPSKKSKIEFIQKMDDIDDFCQKNNILQSKTSDSYYFRLNGKDYRVSNHSPEASYNNSHGKYHQEGRDKDTIYINAGKTRIIDIYNSLKADKKLDNNGRLKEMMGFGDTLGDFTVDEKIEKHESLNPVLWDDHDEMRSEVKDKLLKIVDKFKNNLVDDGIKIDVKDIVVIGSNASYNYTETSDIDVHVIANVESGETGTLLPIIYNAYKSLFNDKHDFRIKGHEVEIYVEPNAVGAKSNGIYSLMTGWIQKPDINKIPDIDMKAFEKEFKVWEDKYFSIVGERDTSEKDLTEDITDEKDVVKPSADQVELEPNTPYMLRQDGALLECGQAHPYIKESLDADFKSNLNYLVNKRPEVLSWFKEHTKNKELSDLLDKNIPLGVDISESDYEKINDLTNEEFCRVRTSNYKYKYGGDNGEVYFRISSTDFDWFDNIWNIVIFNSKKEFIKTITVMKDPQVFKTKGFEYMKSKSGPVDTMTVTDFLTLNNFFGFSKTSTDSNTGVRKYEDLNLKSSDINVSVDVMDKFIKDLYELRQDSIVNEGEYGIGNLVFKEFRNLGYLDNLKNIKTGQEDKELSLEKLQ